MRRWTLGKRRCTNSPATQFRQYCCERLESRRLLSTIVWTNLTPTVFSAALAPTPQQPARKSMPRSAPGRASSSIFVNRMGQIGLTSISPWKPPGRALAALEASQLSSETSRAPGRCCWDGAPTRPATAMAMAQAISSIPRPATTRNGQVGRSSMRLSQILLPADRQMVRGTCTAWSPLRWPTCWE